MPNETELAMFTSIGRVRGRSRGRGAVARRTGNRGGVVTLGARGALVVSRGRRRIAPVKVKRSIRPARASVHRQFRLLFRRRLGLEAALAQATRYAADPMTKRGAQKSFATEAEFEAFCAKLAGERRAPPPPQAGEGAQRFAYFGAS